MTIFKKSEDIEYLNEIRKLWNTLKAECGRRWCMPDEYDKDRKLLTIGMLMERLEKRMPVSKPCYYCRNGKDKILKQDIGLTCCPNCKREL